MKLLTRIAGELLYVCLLFIIFLIRILPYRIAIATGRFFGILAWICIPLHRKISQIQIRHSLKDVNEKLITLKVFMKQGDIIIDTIKFAYMSDDELKKRIRIEGREHIESAVASGRGVMMFTGHMNWEILGHIPRVLGIEFCIMGDIMKNPRIQSIIEDMRSRCGFTLLPPKGGMVSMLINELKAGRTIGIIIDQRGRRENRVFCNIFGLPAPTSPAPALIALKGDALIQSVSAIKQGDTYTFRFEQPIDSREFSQDFEQIEHLGDCWRSTAIHELSQSMHSWLSSVVMKCPDQYFWFHSRWLRRSDMKRIIKSGEDFKECVYAQAEKYLETK